MPDTPLPSETKPALPPGFPPPPRRRGGLGRWLWRLFLLALLVLAAAAAAIRYGWWQPPEAWNLPIAWLRPAPAAQQQAQRGPGGRFGGPVAVTVAPAVQQDIPVTLDALGTVQAFYTITVRAQVDGIITSIAFNEGQEVKRGEILAQIDPRPYQAALAQAQAKKAQDEALLANARLDLQRYTQLSRNEGVSRQQADTQRALVAQYEAQVQADQAAIDSARTQLDFTTIRSPIDGRVGLRLVDPGNLASAGANTGIVTVTQTRPIAINFTLPQQQLPAVQDAMAAGDVPVVVLDPAGQERASGKLLTIDNQVDTSTGTIRLKAVFPNEDQRLWPGSYVNVRLRVATLRGVTAIPLVAVQRGPQGAFAFVLQPDSTVQQRPLQLGMQTATVAVVREGVALGDRVVTSGGLRLTPGAQVSLADGPGGAAPPRGPGGDGRRRPPGAP